MLAFSSDAVPTNRPLAVYRCRVQVSTLALVGVVYSSTLYLCAHLEALIAAFAVLSARTLLARGCSLS